MRTHILNSKQGDEDWGDTVVLQNTTLEHHEYELDGPPRAYVAKERAENPHGAFISRSQVKFYFNCWLKDDWKFYRDGMSRRLLLYSIERFLQKLVIPAQDAPHQAGNKDIQSTNANLKCHLRLPRHEFSNHRLWSQRAIEHSSARINSVGHLRDGHAKPQ